jgi:nucleoside-diphosphate-sugar epimerase
MILVTGGTGLVGSHLLYRFRESELPITAIYRDKAQLAKTRAIFNFYKPGDAALLNRFNWVQADLTNVPSLEAIMTGIKSIYHCAALIEGSFEDLKRVNVTGTENLINVAINNHVRKLCYVSSIAVLAEPTGNRPANEDDFFNLDARNSDYAISKFGGEMEVWRASQEGMDVVIVNAGVVIGEGNWNSGSGKLFSKTAGKQPFYTSGSSGFVDVRDVTAAMHQLMDSDIVNERFILVATNETYKNILCSIASALGKKAPNILLRKWMLYLIYIPQLLGSILGIKKSLSRATINTLVSKNKYSSDAITERLSFTFQPLDTSIKRVAQAYFNYR